MVALELRLVEGQACQRGSLALSDHHGQLELSNKLSWLLDENGVGDKELVLEAFLNADTSCDGVFEGVEAEAEGGVPFDDVVEELSALLDLEVVAAVQCPLVDSATHISLLGLALPTTNVDVEGEDVMHGELLHVHPLLESFLVDDDLSVY